MNAILTALEQKKIIDLTGIQKNDALEVLAESFYKTDELPATPTIASLVFLRESKGVTSLGNGLAIPHAVVNAPVELQCAIGWSKTGIAYGDEKNYPVSLICMYLVPEQKRNEYLKEISLLVKNYSQPQTRAEFSRATGIKDIHNVLINLFRADEGKTDAPGNSE
jgi:mannitol/fructose-specific phosphotransferase system IIA component (Ntr-type)